MDHLKEGIGLRGYGQKDPVREYQKEGYDMFMDMIARIKEDTVQKLCMVQIRREEEVERIEEKRRQDYIMSRGEDTPAPDDDQEGGGQRSDGTIPAPAEAGKNTRSAAAHSMRTVKRITVDRGVGRGHCRMPRTR